MGWVIWMMVGWQKWIGVASVDVVGWWGIYIQRNIGLALRWIGLEMDVLYPLTT